ncbi:phosphatidylglycerophosphatase A family protein [Gilvimarinus sp. F26214L]|uniref:phosphatidylglycerophosphatase A family protein n=1 Tax=Gilvimarinus sp. DZF01 TaxID=3461371 RepID=UPI00404675ED
MTQLPTPSFSELLRNPAQWLAFGFGSGLAPKAPGTFGTVAAIPFYFLMRDLSLPVYLAVVVVTFALGIWLCEVAARAQQVHDHPGIVWDEMVGYWLTMVLAPSGWMWPLLGFILFRFFDILKPWPIGWVDRRVRGGLGIMLDDIIAAVYALACLQLIAYLSMG